MFVYCIVNADIHDPITVEVWGSEELANKRLKELGENKYRVRYMELNRKYVDELQETIKAIKDLYLYTNSKE